MWTNHARHSHHYPRGTEASENLNRSKAAGPDQIPAWILKICTEELAPALQQLFQQSLTEGVVSEDWRTANVTSIFKKGDRSKAANYRQVSLTAIVCKLMQHILVSQGFSQAPFLPSTEQVINQEGG